MYEQKNIKTTLSQPESLRFLQDLLRGNGYSGIAAFTKAVCEKFDFKLPNGTEMLATTITALHKLKEQGLLDLPFEKGEQIDSSTALEPVPLPKKPDLNAEKSGLKLVLVEGKERIAIYDSIFALESGCSRALIGRQVEYLIENSDGECVGIFGFDSPNLNCQARDSKLGLNKEWRSRYLHYFVNLRHFYMRVGWEGYFQEALALLEKHLQADFENVYGYMPLAIETQANPESFYFDGFSAANFILLGHGKPFRSLETAAKTRKRKKFKKKKKSVDKPQQVLDSIFYYPIDRDFRSKIDISKPEKMTACEYLNSTLWAKTEFGLVEFDKRSREKIIEISAEMGRKIGKSIACITQGEKNKRQSFYRLIETKNNRVNFDSILASHIRNTEDRSNAQKEVLWVSDGSDLSYPNLNCKGMGKVGTSHLVNGTNLHVTAGFSTDDEFIGIGCATIGSIIRRTEEDKNQQANMLLEEKNSKKWIYHLSIIDKIARQSPNCRHVFIADRESDFCEFFIENFNRYNKVSSIIRAKFNHALLGKSGKLFEYARSKLTNHTIEIDLENLSDHKKNKSKRSKKCISIQKVNLNIGWCEVELRLPHYLETETRKSVKLNCVIAREKKPRRNKDRIEWIILTDLPVNNIDDAKKIILYYKKRWKIEEFFKVLKSGCKVEHHIFRDIKYLERMIAIDIVVAWRIMSIMLAARAKIDVNLEILLTEYQINVLNGHANRIKKSHPSNLYEAVLMICYYVGYIDAKDRQPGFLIFIEGFNALNTIEYGNRCAVNGAKC